MRDEKPSSALVGLQGLAADGTILSECGEVVRNLQDLEVAGKTDGEYVWAGSGLVESRDVK